MPYTVRSTFGWEEATAAIREEEGRNRVGGIEDENESQTTRVYTIEASDGRRKTKKADCVLDLDPRMVVKVCPMWAE